MTFYQIISLSLPLKLWPFRFNVNEVLIFHYRKQFGCSRHLRLKYVNLWSSKCCFGWQSLYRTVLWQVSYIFGWLLLYRFKMLLLAFKALGSCTYISRNLPVNRSTLINLSLTFLPLSLSIYPVTVYSHKICSLHFRVSSILTISRSLFLCVISPTQNVASFTAPDGKTSLL